MVYTEQEEKMKKYTVKQAVDAAGFICKDKYNRKANVTGFSHRMDEKITLAQLNQISDQIVANSL